MHIVIQRLHRAIWIRVFSIGNGNNHGVFELDFRNWNDATASELLDRGRSELNPVQRKAIYVDFQKRMADTVPTIMLFSADLVTIGNDAVQNYQQHPSGWYYGLARAWLKK